ncbi:DUF596 domain-containing protein [Dyella silvatica]|uniref:DUF596 domain-containing protein n=1 Tax=Dyella silvatica TaxID=2992128 RepID=UPI0022576AEA|nr:DUF596 domain-containing protein [Dyella silvatica]
MEVFFKILKCLMVDGHLKLAADGKCLAGSIDEQIDVIKSAWPMSPEDDELDGFGLWFLMGAPAGVVWFTSDGQEEIWA